MTNKRAIFHIRQAAHELSEMQIDIVDTYKINMAAILQDKEDKRDHYGEHQVIHHNLGFPEFLILVRLWKGMQATRIQLQRLADSLENPAMD